jgi:hypothetical protein
MRLMPEDVKGAKTPFTPFQLQQQEVLFAEIP